VIARLSPRGHSLLIGAEISPQEVIAGTVGADPGEKVVHNHARKANISDLLSAPAFR
jgi:hypothetical protein